LRGFSATAELLFTSTRRERQGIVVGGVSSFRCLFVPFGMEKLELCGYPMVKKFEDMFSRFDGTAGCDRRTD